MDKSSKTARFTISLPEELLSFLDERLVADAYASRSECIRDLIREKMVENKWKTDEKVYGVLTLIYHHHAHDLLERLTELQHKHHLHIRCTLHIHLDQDSCLEVVLVEGSGREIEKITHQLSGFRGVKFAHLTRTAPVNP